MEDNGQQDQEELPFSYIPTRELLREATRRLSALRQSTDLLMLHKLTLKSMYDAEAAYRFSSGSYTNASYISAMSALKHVNKMLLAAGVGPLYEAKANAACREPKSPEADQPDAGK